MNTLHLAIYSYNGTGFVIFDYLALSFEVLSHLSITILLLLMSMGWTIKYKELPDFDILIPLCFFIIMIHFLIIGFNRIIEDSYYKFSDYEGVPGVLILIGRLLIWLYFSWSAHNLYLKEQGICGEFRV